MARIRIGVTGVEHWHAPRHIEGFTRAGAEIVGITGDPAYSQKYAEKNGYHMYDNLRTLVKKEQPDFMVVLGKPREMAELAQTLITMKVPFAVEKPVGLSGRETEVLAEQAEAGGLFVAVPFVSRYSRIWDHFRDFQVLSHGHFRVINGSPQRYIRDGVEWVLNEAVSGGGCMRNLGIHGADAFLHATGNAPYTIIGAVKHNNVHKMQVEEFAACTAVSQNGMVMTIESGYSFAAMQGGDFEFRIATNSSYIIDRNTSLQVASIDTNTVDTFENIDQAGRYTAFAQDTLYRLSKGLKPAADLASCYHAMRFIDEFYAVAQKSRRNEL